mgnify:CR=1 FL=1
MFEKLIRFSIEQRWLVLLAALAMGALGVFNDQNIGGSVRVKTGGAHDGLLSGEQDSRIWTRRSP